MEEIYQIYDRIFKRLFSLSHLAVINLINGLFNTDYPLDSEVIMTNVEHVNGVINKRLADVFITINGYTYHLEAQMQKDSRIVIRVFEYGFYHALQNMEEDTTTLSFPDPVIIYVGEVSNIPAESSITLLFNGQGTFTYSVKNFLYLQHDIQELNQKKMVLLIPFQVLKANKILQESKSEVNFVALQKLLSDDIVNSIKANEAFGNITSDDAAELLELVRLLLLHICNHYDELGGMDDMRKQLLEGAIELPLDKYRFKISDLEEEVDSLKQKCNSYEEKCNSIEEENIALKKALAELQRKQDK